MILAKIGRIFVRASRFIQCLRIRSGRSGHEAVTPYYGTLFDPGCDWVSSVARARVSAGRDSSRPLSSRVPATTWPLRPKPRCAFLCTCSIKA